jgi:hypothetical protein
MKGERNRMRGLAKMKPVDVDDLREKLYANEWNNAGELAAAFKTIREYGELMLKASEFERRNVTDPECKLALNDVRKYALILRGIKKDAFEGSKMSRIGYTESLLHAYESLVNSADWYTSCQPGEAA